MPPTLNRTLHLAGLLRQRRRAEPQITARCLWAAHGWVHSKRASLAGTALASAHLSADPEKLWLPPKTILLLGALFLPEKHPLALAERLTVAEVEALAQQMELE